MRGCEGPIRAGTWGCICLAVLTVAYLLTVWVL